MTKQQEDLVKAFAAGLSLQGVSRGALKVVGNVLYSYDMPIAWKHPNRIAFTNIPAPSKTTAAHINLAKRICGVQ